MSLKGKTLFISGGSQGIGFAIAMRAARDGANIALAARTADTPDRERGGMLWAADAIFQAGGKALPITCNIRDDLQVQNAIKRTVDTFGGVDILVNNASAMQLSGTLETDMSRYDLIQEINARGTFACGKYCVPHLRHASNPHILTLSPPLTIDASLLAPHLAYSMAKISMSLCTLAWAEEFRSLGIAANSLWPRMTIDGYPALLAGSGEDGVAESRIPEIMADAAHFILTRPAREFTGRFCIDEQILQDTGVRDFDRYSTNPTIRSAGIARNRGSLAESSI
jgi:citronellol/citronellal dehydrogenase